MQWKTLVIGIGLVVAAGCSPSSGGLSATTTGLPSRAADTQIASSAIASGWWHNCVLTETGGVKCWGSHEDGQLGDGFINNSYTSPVDVIGLESGVKAIAASGAFSCALTDAGGVQCWGFNDLGQLGDGTNNTRSQPGDVAGLDTGIAAITAGWVHACALTDAGGVKCWGHNFFGQLGDGTKTDSLTPVDVQGLTSGVAAISAGGYFTCALLNNGGVTCWGYNAFNQLGDGTKTDSTVPVDVAGLSSGVASISTGGYHSCALMTDGTMKCWGMNSNGQLGDGTIENRSIPVDVVGSNGISGISAGGFHTCALTNAGGILCWGQNRHGQLGDGTTKDRYTPANVIGLPGVVLVVDASPGGHTCAIIAGGEVLCWGFNRFDQVGDGTTTDRTTPVFVVGLSPDDGTPISDWPT
jgi:alpha-tubulin suppressor-like RCC1 family protein